MLGLTSLCVMTTQVLGLEPYRARRRDLGPQAAILARHLPAGTFLGTPEEVAELVVGVREGTVWRAGL